MINFGKSGGSGSGGSGSDGGGSESRSGWKIGASTSLKLSSSGIFAERVLLWIEFFFIQKQKMKRMNNYCIYHAQHGFK